MSYINKIKEFIESYPKIDELIHVDGNELDAKNYGIYSNGQTTINTEIDILGNEIRQKQYNYVFYVVDVTMDDLIKLDNINFLDEFIEWVENNSDKPIFGDIPEREEISLNNNMLYEDDGTTGTYQIQINITFYKEVKKNG